MHEQRRELKHVLAFLRRISVDADRAFKGVAAGPVAAALSERRKASCDGNNGRVALVDSGFHREQYFRQFTVKDFVKPSEAIAPLGLKPEDVTDLFLSHMHWDHAGGIDLFPSSRIWIQKDEYDYYTSDAWQSARTHGGIDAEDVLELVKRNTRVTAAPRTSSPR